MNSVAYLDTATSGLISANTYAEITKALEKRFEDGLNISEYFQYWDEYRSR